MEKEKIKFIEGMLKIEQEMHDYYEDMLKIAYDIDNPYLVDELNQTLDIKKGKIQALEDCLKILVS